MWRERNGREERNGRGEEGKGVLKNPEKKNENENVCRK